MEYAKEKSLAEILDSMRMFPLSKFDLLRITERYGVDLNFNDDKEISMAIIFYDNQEYHFELKQDKLYYYMEVKNE